MAEIRNLARAGTTIIFILYDHFRRGDSNIAVVLHLLLLFLIQRSFYLLVKAEDKKQKPASVNTDIFILGLNYATEIS